MAVLVFALVAHLKAAPPVAAVVGTRIYPIVLPPNPTLPAITYRTISAPRAYAHSQQRPEARVSERVQLSHWAASYSTAKNLAGTVRTELSGFHGTLGSQMPVGLCAIANELDLIDPNTGDEYVVLDAIFDYAE